MKNDFTDGIIKGMLILFKICLYGVVAMPAIILVDNAQIHHQPIPYGPVGLYLIIVLVFYALNNNRKRRQRERRKADTEELCRQVDITLAHIEQLKRRKNG